MKTSNTAIEQYIRCPRQYHEERHKKNRGQPSQTMLSGRVVHRTIDKLLKNHKERGEADYLDIADANEIFAQEWSAEPGIFDKNLFTSGLQWISDMIDDLGVIDPAHILGTEQWFSIMLDDGTEVVGVIDLVLGVESFDEETGECFLDIEVVDWKTSLSFVSQHDADESLQLSLYLMAARQMFPEARSYTAALHMLPDRNHLATKRSMAELQEDALFVKTTASKIEADTMWLPIVNTSCIYCHLRSDCDAYKDALASPLPAIVADEHDFDGLAKERVRVALLKKLAEKRQKEIDEIFMTHMRSTGAPLELGDNFFRLMTSPTRNYPTLKTCRLLVERLNLDMDHVLESICSVGKTKLDNLLKSYKGDGDTRMIEAALANVVQTSYNQRIFHKSSKPHKKEKKT